MQRRDTREITTTTTTATASRPYTGGWIGYDWFKLAIAAILVALLLYFWLTPQTAAVPAAPASGSIATIPAVQPAAPATGSIATVPVPQPAAPALPVLNLPSDVLPVGEATISGSGEPGATIQVLIDGTQVGEAVVEANGTWSLPVALAEAGEAEVVARMVDASGATLNESTAASITVEAATAAPAPAAPVLAITAPADGADVGSGPITISGTGTPASQVEVLDGDRVVGTATVAADGTWSVSDTPPEATAAYSARTAGSTEAATTVVRVTTGPLATCSTLAVGCDVWVTRVGGLQLRLREGPGTGAVIITRLPSGTQMELLEGPQLANDLNWWRVRTGGGQEGWVAGEQVVLQPD